MYFACKLPIQTQTHTHPLLLQQNMNSLNNNVHAHICSPPNSHKEKEKEEERETAAINVAQTKSKSESCPPSSMIFLFHTLLVDALVSQGLFFAVSSSRRGHSFSSSRSLHVCVSAGARAVLRRYEVKSVSFLLETKILSIRHWQCITSYRTFCIFFFSLSSHSPIFHRALFVLVPFRLSATRACHFSYQCAPLVSLKMNSTDYILFSSSRISFVLRHLNFD